MAPLKSLTILTLAIGTLAAAAWMALAAAASPDLFVEPGQGGILAPPV